MRLHHHHHGSRRCLLQLHIPPRTISTTTLVIATGGAPIAIYQSVLLFFYRMPYSCLTYCKQRTREPNRQYQRLQCCKMSLPCTLQILCIQRSRPTGEPFICLHCILAIINLSRTRSSSAELSPQFNFFRGGFPGVNSRVSCTSLFHVHCSRVIHIHNGLRQGN